MAEDCIFGRGHHRKAYERHIGHAIPPKMCVHHRCFNHACLNPNHMELLTNSQHSKLHQGIRSARIKEAREKRRPMLLAWMRKTTIKIEDEAVERDRRARSHGAALRRFLEELGVATQYQIRQAMPHKGRWNRGDIERYHEEHPELVHEEIADRFGISRQRVQQILSAYKKKV